MRSPFSGSIWIHRDRTKARTPRSIRTTKRSFSTAFVEIWTVSWIGQVVWTLAEWTIILKSMMVVLFSTGCYYQSHVSSWVYPIKRLVFQSLQFVFSPKREMPLHWRLRFRIRRPLKVQLQFGDFAKWWKQCGRGSPNQFHKEPHGPESNIPMGRFFHETMGFPMGFPHGFPSRQAVRERWPATVPSCSTRPSTTSGELGLDDVAMDI